MGGASLPSMTVRIFRAWTWTISLVAVEVICATGYAVLMSRLVAGWDCLATLRHAGKLRHYEVAVRNVEIEAFTRRHQCELGLCTPLLEPVGEAVDQAVPERLDRHDQAWAVRNRIKHRAVPFVCGRRFAPLLPLWPLPPWLLCSATYGDEFGCRLNKKIEGAHGSHVGAVGITADTIIRFPIVRAHDCSAGPIAGILLMSASDRRRPHQFERSSLSACSSYSAAMEFKVFVV
jgi:hypothetical protein